MLALLVRAALLLPFLAAPLCAQGDWFVDPVAGSNGAAGTLGDPWQSVTYAFSQAAPGDTVFLQSGSYESTAIGGMETFPMPVPNEVTLRAAPGATPVLDVGNFEVGLTLPDSSDGITLSGLQVVRAAPAVSSAGGVGVWGSVEIRDCVLDDVDGGIQLTVPSTSATAELLILDCTVTLSSTSTLAGIEVQLQGSARYADGRIAGCTLSGGLDGVVLGVDGDAVFDNGFAVRENVIAVGDGGRGIQLHAGPVGTAGTARISSLVQGNQVTGGGLGTETGISLSAQALLAGVVRTIDAPLRFNRISMVQDGLLVATENDGAQTASVTSAAFGNRFLDCTGNAVSLSETMPNAAQTNVAVDLGSEVAGANTFSGNASDLLATGVTATIDARRNFFPGGAPTVGGGTFETSEQLLDTLDGTVDGDPKSGEESPLDLMAAASVRFVDDPGAGPEQMSATIDGAAVAASSFGAPLPGESVGMLLPSLDEGGYDLIVTNPGGQTGTFRVNVDALYDGCFVATAAHGDYGAPEVLALRRFRDQYLQTTPAGRAAIRSYYEHGPAAAAWIAERPWARSASRVALSGPVAVAAALDRWNPGQRFAFAVLLSGLALALLRRRSPAA